MTAETHHLYQENLQQAASMHKIRTEFKNHAQTGSQTQGQSYIQVYSQICLPPPKKIKNATHKVIKPRKSKGPNLVLNLSYMSLVEMHTLHILTVHESEMERMPFTNYVNSKRSTFLDNQRL